jgi:hypothetical protein
MLTSSYGQEKTLLSNTNQVNFGLGVGSSGSSISASYVHDWRLGKKKTFYIGAGARLTNFFGKDVSFQSAPANLAADESFIDTLFYTSPSVHSLNAYINLGVNITPTLAAGFNIDLLGFSLGKNDDAIFTTNATTQTTTAKPTAFNLLLVGNNDLGSLNSQFYLRYAISQRFGVMAAYQYLFNEVTTASTVQVVPETNDRFRNKSSMVYAGITYNF